MSGPDHHAACLIAADNAWLDLGRVDEGLKLRDACHSAPGFATVAHAAILKCFHLEAAVAQYERAVAAAPHQVPVARYAPGDDPTAGLDTETKRGNESTLALCMDCQEPAPPLWLAASRGR